MKMKKIVFAIVAVALVAFCFCTSIIAFDANDYDFDFDFDSGSGGDEGSLIGLFFMGGGIPGVIVAVIIIVLVTILKAKSKGKGGGVRPAGGAQGLNVFLPDRTTQIEAIIKESDPNFSSSDFISFAKQVYIDIEDAWCKRDLTPVRPVLHENLYNTTNRQIQSKIEQGVVYHYESIAINTAYLTSYIKDAQFEYLTMYLNARMIDYQVDEKTGNIIRGDKTTRWDLRYKMKFVRSVGVLTKQESAEATRHNCPNCGAPLEEMTSAGKCGYCGSIVTTGQYSWVLTDFTTIRNDTRDEGVIVPRSDDNNNNGGNA